MGYWIFFLYYLPWLLVLCYTPRRGSTNTLTTGMNEWAGEQPMAWRLPGVMEAQLGFEGRVGFEGDKSMAVSSPGREEDQQGQR